MVLVTTSLILTTTYIGCTRVKDRIENRKTIVMFPNRQSNSSLGDKLYYDAVRTQDMYRNERRNCDR